MYKLHDMSGRLDVSEFECFITVSTGSIDGRLIEFHEIVYPVSSSEDEDEEVALDVPTIAVDSTKQISTIQAFNVKPSDTIVLHTGNTEIVDKDKDTDIEFIKTVPVPFPNHSDAFRQIQIKQEPIYDSDSESVATTTNHISDSESLDSSDISDHDDDKVKAKKRQPPKAKGELWLQDLPPIEDLHISVPHEECEAIGFIKSIVETLVVVEAYPLTPAMDIDSVLFLQEGDQALGHIFDVFGPVKHPHYCVRFNSKDHIDSRGVKVGDLVYSAPKTPHTAYILVAQLQKYKGTDASWKDDHETPKEQLDFSDDEAERAAKGSQTVMGVDGVPERRIAKRGNRRSRPRGGIGHSNGHNYNQNYSQCPPPPGQGPVPYVPTEIPGFRPPRQRFFRPNRGRGFAPRAFDGYHGQYYPPPPPPPFPQGFHPGYPPQHQPYYPYPPHYRPQANNYPTQEQFRPSVTQNGNPT